MTEHGVVCYRHADARAGVSCQRCGKPICANCMKQASVGFHCPECVQGSTSRVVSARAVMNRPPIVTQVLIAVNVAVFVLMVFDSGTIGGDTGPLFIDGALNAGALPLVGGGYVRVDGVADGEWWRLVTSGFLHFGPFHLAMNMYVLWILGQLVEPVYGRTRFVAVYAASMLCGSAGALALDPFSFTAGSSGAIFGLMGAGLVLLWQRGVNPMQTSLGQVVMINVAITFFIPGISIGGHLGGLVGGAASAWLLATLDDERTGEGPGVGAVVGLGFAAAALAIFAANQAIDTGLPLLG